MATPFLTLFSILSAFKTVPTASIDDKSLIARAKKLTKNAVKTPISGTDNGPIMDWGIPKKDSFRLRALELPNII